GEGSGGGGARIGDDGGAGREGVERGGGGTGVSIGPEVGGAERVDHHEDDVGAGAVEPSPATGSVEGRRSRQCEEEGYADTAPGSAHGVRAGREPATRGRPVPRRSWRPAIR